MTDRTAQQLLIKVVRQWQAAGHVDVLLSLTEEVWRRNVDRHESRIGDDAMTLGILSSRNLMNLSAPLLRKLPGTAVKSYNTLEVHFAGRVLHTSKAPSSSPHWNVERIDWSASDVRYDGATANTAAYMPVEGTLLEDYGPLPRQPADPDALRHLHWAWQGFPDGGTRCWMGFPRLGYPAWFAVVCLVKREGGGSNLPVSAAGPEKPKPTFDSMREPNIEMIRRVDPHSA